MKESAPDLPAENNDSVRAITDRYADLTEGERKIADYIISHVSEIAYLSARELADKVSLSEASVSRFCQTFGYHGFREFKIAIAKGSATYDDYVVDFDLSGDSLEQSVRRVALASVQSIRSTIESLDLEALRKAAQSIDACRRLYFFGFGTSAVVCEDAVIKFMRLNIPSFRFSDPHVGAAALSLVNGDDVAVAVTHSGTTPESVHLAGVAKTHGAFTVGITTYPQAAVSKHCDVLLKTMTRESPMHSSAITSRMSQLAVVDSLFMAMVSLRYPEAKDSLAKVFQTIRSFRDE